MIKGEPGSGKSFMATAIGSNYPRIISNLEIKRNGKTINSVVLKDIEQLKYMKYNRTKGIIIFEESGVNANSRRSNTDGNLEVGFLCMLGRKLNCDLCFITQFDFLADKYIREFSKYCIEMNSYFVSKDKLMFEFTVFGRNNIFIKSGKVDLIEWSKSTGITYNTLESSKIR